MPRLYFHLRGAADSVLDIEGMEMAESDVAAHVMRTARDLIAHDVRSGRADLRLRIDVENNDGKVVHSLSFSDAVTISHA